jgi:hypothetical protein
LIGGTAIAAVSISEQAKLRARFASIDASHILTTTHFATLTMGWIAGGACWSGRTMARTGLRMMPTSPSPPLRFRKAGFPRYGSKAGLSDRAFPDHPSVKLAPSVPVA